MSKLTFPITVTTSILTIFLLGVGFEINHGSLMVLILLVHVSFFWMVYRILKDGTPSEKSFDEYFYEDREIKRNHHPN